MLVISHRWWQMSAKNQGKQLPLIITVQGVWSSFWKFYKGWKQGLPFWTWIQVAVDEMAPYDIVGEKKFKNAPSAWKIMATIWGWERCYSWELIALGDDSELWLLYWNSMKFECLPSSSSSHNKNARSVAASWHCRAKHHCVHHWGHYKIEMDSVATPAWEFWSWTITLAPVWSFDRQPVRQPLCKWWGTVEYHGPVAIERRATFVSWEYMLSFEGERRVLIKMKTALKSNCVLSDTLVNSCEIFTHLTYKWFEKQFKLLLCDWPTYLDKNGFQILLNCMLVIKSDVYSNCCVVFRSACIQQSFKTATNIHINKVIMKLCYSKAVYLIISVGWLMISHCVSEVRFIMATTSTVQHVVWNSIQRLEKYAVVLGLQPMKW